MGVACYGDQDIGNQCMWQNSKQAERSTQVDAVREEEGVRAWVLRVHHATGMFISHVTWSKTPIASHFL